MIKVFEAWVDILEQNTEFAAKLSLFIAPLLVLLSAIYVALQEQEKKLLKQNISNLESELKRRPTLEEIRGKDELISQLTDKAEEYKKEIRDYRKKLEEILEEKESLETKIEITTLIKKLSEMERSVDTRMTRTQEMINSQEERLTQAWEKTFGKSKFPTDIKKKRTKYSPQWLLRLLKRD
jgi:chromosome segregation ATPase